MKTKISILIGLFCFIIGALTTCSSGDGEATLVLHLNGNSSVYSASSLQNWPPADNSELASLRYEINLSNSSGKRTETASGLGPIIFTLTPGYWFIEVTAYTSNELYAYGITEVSLSMGQNDVQVTLRRAGDYIILINVIPESVSVNKGASHTFSAATFCASSADVTKHSTYVWSVSGNTSGLTSITQGGLLTVGSDETASTLTVKAASALKDSIFGIATVIITSYTLYTVTFDANGASGTVPAALTVTAGSAITLPNPTGLTKTGHTFEGWNTQPNGAGTDYIAASSYTPTGSIILYAKWKSTPSFNITFAQIEEQAPVISGIIISRSGTGGYSTTGTISVSNPGDYDPSSFKWYIDGYDTGIGVTTNSSITLDATNSVYNGVGKHYLTLEVEKGTMWYSITIEFEVKI